ncbi:MAG: hypothetical protein LBI48_01940 [Burkholderiaceae bacterium]|nr:hypothetical protein [Burkholderiaceae bacterium]
MTQPFTPSKSEEIIAALWAICALLAFGFGFTVWGWVFTVKAAFDAAITITLAVFAIAKEHGNG